MSLIKKLLGMDIDSYLSRAEKYEGLGKLGMARLELERALEISVLEDEVRARINRLLDGLSAKQQEDAFSRAQEALRKGNHNEAKYYLNIALSSLEEGSPQYSRLKEQLDSIPDTEEEDEIEDDLDTVVKVDLGVNFLNRQRNLEFWKSGFPPYKEEYYFKKALTSDVVLAQSEQVERNPEDADACFNFAITLAQLGMTSKALDQIRRFVGLRPDDRDGHYFLANLLGDQGFDDEAIREFERTVGLDPQFMEAYYYLAEHYINLEDFERAERLYSHIVQNEKGSSLAEEAEAKLETLRNARKDDST